LVIEKFAETRISALIRKTARRRKSADRLALRRCSGLINESMKSVKNTFVTGINNSLLKNKFIDSVF